MGLLDLILGKTNPAAQWADQNSNWLGGVGAGLGAGTNLGQSLGLAAQYGAAAKPADIQAAQQLSDQQKVQEQQNQTIQWLHASGNDDLVPLVTAGQAGTALTEAIRRKKGEDPQYFNVGDGTIVAAQNGKATPIYQGSQTQKQGAAPSGYRWTKDSGLEPIPGGPADPASAQGLTPESLDLIASQYLAGDKSAITGYARNANMRAQIANRIAQMADEQGMDGKAIAAEVSAYGGNVAAQRSAGTRAAQVGMAASEANQMADIALQASQKVPRGAFVPWNTAMNAVATGTSSPEMAQFVTATTSLVNAYARAVSPLGAPTDAMRAHAEQMLNTAQGPEAYAAVIAQMKKEMEAALNAPAEVSKRLKEGITGGSGAAPVDMGGGITIQEIP